MKRFRKFIDDSGEVHYERIFLSSKDSTDKEHAKSHEGISEAKGFKATLSRTEVGVTNYKKGETYYPDRIKAHILNVDHNMKDVGGEYTPDEKHAIEHYTEDGHKSINHNLYHGLKHDNEFHQETDDNLSSAIKKRTISRNMTLYSGMRSPEKLPSHNGHKLLQNPAYTSTSTSPEQAAPFGSRKNHDGTKTAHTYHQYSHEQYDPKKHTDYEESDTSDQNMRLIKHKEDDSKGSFTGYSHVAKIHVPQGSHGMYPGRHSLNSGEDEVILHKNAKIAFKEKPVVDHETRTVQWHGYLVHDGVKQTRHGIRMNLGNEKKTKPKTKKQ
jgi:hypothetical protein